MATYEPSVGNGHHASASNVGQRVGQLGDSAQQFFSDARGAVSDFNQMLDINGRLERHPYATLAVAAGIGYILGGGLFTRLTGRIVHLGLRFAALPLVKSELISMAESALDGLTQSAQAPGPRGDS